MKKIIAQRRIAAWLTCVMSLAISTTGGAQDPELINPASEERDDYIRRARVWEQADVRSMDLYNGPKGKLDFAVDQEVTCEFVRKPMEGWTEKFLCRLEDGTIVKVKYDKGDRFKETYGEVLGTRLFWALGFHADRVLPVRVTCRNCPKDPWEYVDARESRSHVKEGEPETLPPEAEAGTYTFDPATIEERLDAIPIEQEEDQGWKWKELDMVDAGVGGATRAQVDAFKLLNAFVQNADNKHTQNSLVCPLSEVVKDASGRVTCRRPIMYVSDLGAVFGRGGFITGYDGRVDYEGWKRREVWKNKGKCKARLESIGGGLRTSTLSDPLISEEGRALLADLLAQLSDAQIRDLFRAARIEKLDQTVPGEALGRRRVTMDDWVALFKTKRDEITHHPGCPPRQDGESSMGEP